jgi:type VI secretion system protein ImpG
LAGGNGSYEIEQGHAQEGGGYLYWLMPYFPTAFEQPRTLLVEALWQQPWYDEYLKKNYRLHLFHRQVPGIKWELVDTPTPHTENNYLNTNAGYIHLLTLMHKAAFNLQNTQDLLLALGNVASSEFSTIFNSLVDLRMEEELLVSADKRMTRQIYYLQFKPQPDENTALIDTFVQHVGQVMDVWIGDSLVETRWEIKDPLHTASLSKLQ